MELHHRLTLISLVTLFTGKGFEQRVPKPAPSCPRRKLLLHRPLSDTTLIIPNLQRFTEHLCYPTKWWKRKPGQAHGSRADLSAAKDSQDELSAAPQSRPDAAKVAPHPVSITHPAHLPIHSPQPRRMGLPMNPKLQ
ncbi:hypothetical protein TESG_01720 [Trichophyton tonsurans CBS 112818]|uniref:Uncharacterized protein n=1 Tax=Trichophyton tonsurans (strain CBS 112818) TaxID=647933 RepID=F2RS99_TRIT1|nr:hypothetical protein TESG_01720 [Trichophyton tonsurans CBS 112818]